MLMATCQIYKQLGHRKIIYEAIRQLNPDKLGLSSTKFYELERVERKVAELTAAGWQIPKTQWANRGLDDGRWQPSHPGPWTNEDFAEFNRRHPFRRDYLFRMLNELSTSPNGRTSHCKGRH